MASVVTTKATEKTFELGLEDIESWTGRLLNGESTYDAPGVAFEEGDVLFGKLRPYLAKVYQAERRGQAVGDFIVLRPSPNVHPRYLVYNLLEAELIGRLTASAYGSKMPRTNWDDLGGQRVMLPPLAEQRRIAAFLDHETARIDELVREQEQLIVLINEKRSAYVSHLVTQGQDSSAQKQDSGVELLGDVPSHWEVAKLGRLAVKIGSGKTPRGGATAYVDEGVLFLRSQNVYDDGLRLESVVYIDTDTDEEMRGSRVCPMDVLINITGASIGRATIVPQEFPPANVNQHVAIIRLRQPSELAKWIAVVLQTSYAKTLVQLAMSGAARDGLTGEELAQFRVPVPPLEERKAIIAHLEDLESDWAHLTETANQSKRLLLERRSALISAAVTGQLDLRNWQPPEPEAVAEVA